VYSENADPKIVTPALAGLRHVSVSDPRSRPRKKARARRKS
jgi:hypothetical protein